MQYLQSVERPRVSGRSCGAVFLEAVTQAPLPIPDERPPELGQLVQRPEDRLSVGDREREHLQLGVIGVLEPLGSVVEASVSNDSRDLEHVLVTDGEAGEHHRSERTPVRVALLDLGGCDRRHAGFIDIGHASADHAAADEAHHADGLANSRQMFRAVLVELIYGARRVFRDERHAVGPHLGHYGTMAVIW